MHCDADDVGWIASVRITGWLPAAEKKRNISNIPGGIRSAINRAGRGAKNHAALNI